jgi:hyperosmotically inducible protein
MKFTPIVVILGLIACGCDTSGRATHDPENTSINQRDRSNLATTPLDQHQDQADIDITANIRKQVVDSEMSVNAHNVKITTQNGNVTLRGPVTTADEKSNIERIASNVAGVTRVDNQLDVSRAN